MNESPNKQLQDALDYACARGRFLAGHDLIFRFTGFQRPKATPTRHIHINGDGFEGVQRDAFVQVFDECAGNMSAVRRKLRVSRETAYNWKKRFLVVLPLLLLLCGCGAPTPPISRTTPQIMLSLPAVTNRATVPFVNPPPPQYLAWDNPNPIGLWPYMWVEIKSTTNLSQPFKTAIWKPLGSNYVYRPATNSKEFFIARFAVVTSTETNYSDWNQK